MLTTLFLKGLLIGLSVAMPIGPVGMLCIHQTLKRGLWVGFLAGFGSAIADALCGCAAIFGISYLSHLVSDYQIFLQILGAVILWVLGIKIFKSHPSLAIDPEKTFKPARLLFSTFILTVTNPFTFFCFAALYASLGILPQEEPIVPSMALSMGIFLGAAFCWFGLSLGISFISKKYQIQSSPALNRISGTFLTGCGFLASLSVIKQLLYFV